MMLSIDVVNLGRRCPWLRHCANNGDLRAKLMFILHHVLESMPHLPTSIRTPNKDWTRRQRLTQSSNVDTTRLLLFLSRPNVSCLHLGNAPTKTLYNYTFCNWCIVLVGTFIVSGAVLTVQKKWHVRLYAASLESRMMLVRHCQLFTRLLLNWIEVELWR